MNNPTDNDASGQTDPKTRSELPGFVEVEMQRRFNEFRREVLDNWAKTINWWLAAIAIVFAIVAVVGGYIGFERFQRIENEAKNSVEEAKGYAEVAKNLVEEITTQRDEAEKMVKAIREMNAQIADDAPEKAKQVVANISENPEALPLDKAIARAVSLQQQGKRNDAIEKWRAVAHVAEESDTNLAATAWF